MQDSAIEVLNYRLAKGEITPSQYDELRGRIAGTTDPRPNVTLLVISTVVTLFVITQAALTKQESPNMSPGEALLAGFGLCALWPLLVIWVRALWNTVVPPITGWTRVTFWQTAGILMLGLLLNL